MPACALQRALPHGAADELCDANAAEPEPFQCPPAPRPVCCARRRDWLNARRCWTTGRARTRAATGRGAQQLPPALRGLALPGQPHAAGCAHPAAVQQGDTLVDWRCSQAMSRAWGAATPAHTGWARPCRWMTPSGWRAPSPTGWPSASAMGWTLVLVDAAIWSAPSKKGPLTRAFHFAPGGFYRAASALILADRRLL